MKLHSDPYIYITQKPMRTINIRIHEKASLKNIPRQRKRKIFRKKNLIKQFDIIEKYMKKNQNENKRQKKFPIKFLLLNPAN